MMLLTEKYIREQILKGTGHLVDIFTDTNSIKHTRAFNTYTAYTQVCTYHNNKHEDKMPPSRTRGLVLVERSLMAGRTRILDMKLLRLWSCNEAE